MGNGPAHEFLYEPLLRVPGPARPARPRAPPRAGTPVPRLARGPRLRGRPVERREARAPRVPRSRPTATRSPTPIPASGERLAEAHLATVGDLLPYAYPLFRIPVEASRAGRRAQRVHGGGDPRRGAVGRGREHPDGGASAWTSAGGRSVRPAGPAGLRPDDFVVGCFGLLTPREAGSRPWPARSRALLRPSRACVCSSSAPCPDRGAWRSTPRPARRRPGGPWSRAACPSRTLPAHMEAADLVVHLRYPTARETSAALLRVLAQGRPAVDVRPRAPGRHARGRGRARGRRRRGGRADAGDPPPAGERNLRRAARRCRPRFRGARASLPTACAPPTRRRSSGRGLDRSVPPPWPSHLL